MQAVWARPNNMDCRTTDVTDLSCMHVAATTSTKVTPLPTAAPPAT